MSYTLIGTHVESLHDGRMVGCGDSISDADAKRNQNLIDRGVLTKDAERRKPTKTEPSPKAELEAAAAPQEKEESK